MSCASAAHESPGRTLREYLAAAKATPPVSTPERSAIHGVCRTCGAHVEWVLWPRRIEISDALAAALAEGRR